VTEQLGPYAETGDLKPARDWHRGYSVRLAVTDFLVLIWVVFGVQIAWLGLDTQDVSFQGNPLHLALNYTTVSVIIILGWMACLSIFATRGYRVLGTGPDEYKLIANASIRLFGAVAIVAFLFQVNVARGYILIAFPLGIAVLWFSRWMWRQWLTVQRQRGSHSSTVLLVGSVGSVANIARELQRHVEAGYQVLGACIPNGAVAGFVPGTNIPIFGDLEHLPKALADSGADTVMITSSDHLPAQRVRELSWSLEPGRQHLVVAPSLTDIGGPRIHTRPVAGLPLIHVETPCYEGRKQFSKRAFDFVIAAALLVFCSPILVVLALVVRFTSDGPVLYRQERVGLKGGTFHMLKFRSMTVNADDQLAELLEAQGRHDRPGFKVANDPRLTRVGALLRKYSLDELPQLMNVLKGEMSLVGPRPQRESEVALYDSAAARRLFVKPGMSGLWQVSGRSTLSWEDSIRLDLYYVDNWSMAGDVVILWRTFRAVAAPGNAAR
jgi:exopolysaccharide biosynthesis polyprenyl glycosylphosphotransferase